MSIVLQCIVVASFPPRELLLVAESREERKKWMDKLQEQNSSLLEHERKSSATLEVKWGLLALAVL